MDDEVSRGTTDDSLVSGSMSLGKWTFDGPSPADGAIERWASLSRIYLRGQSFSSGMSEEEKSNFSAQSMTLELVDPTAIGLLQETDRDEISSEVSESGVSALTENDLLATSDLASEPGFMGSGIELADGSAAFKIERAKWQAYFSGLRMALKVDDDNNADRTNGPIILLCVMLIISWCNFLPLLSKEKTDVKEMWNMWNIDSDVFHVVVALALGACFPVMIELIGALFEQFRNGTEEPEALLNLTLSRFLFVLIHFAQFLSILVTAMLGGFQGRFKFYTCFTNNYYTTISAIFIFFAATHLTHWSLWRYLGLFCIFSVNVGLQNYARFTRAYNELTVFLLLPLSAITFISHIYYTYSVWSAVRAGRYRSRSGSMSVPAATVLIFQAAIGASIVLERVSTNITENQQFESNSLWVSCVAPVVRTILVVLVAIMPIKLSRLLALKTRRYLKTIQVAEREIELTTSSTRGVDAEAVVNHV